MAFLGLKIAKLKIAKIAEIDNLEKQKTDLQKDSGLPTPDYPITRDHITRSLSFPSMSSVKSVVGFSSVFLLVLCG